MQDDEMPPLEDLKPLSEFETLLGVNHSTVFRWVKYGVKPGPIYLRAWQLKEWCTTRKMVDQFIQQRTAAKLADSRKTVSVPKGTDKRAAKAKAALQREGFRLSK